MSVARAMLRAAAALALAVPLSAHVGSPDVFHSGMAGPYEVEVVIRPPQVVPGLAEVLVRAADPAVSRVVIRPVYWDAGTKGAPSGDEAARVAGAPGSFTGQLWLMAAGPYVVHVTATGPRGSGTAVVPVAAVATGQLTLGARLGALLAALGILLVAGIATAIHAAVGESLVPPGEPVPPVRRRRARIAVLVSLPLLALIVFGGARWWGAEARAYRRTLDKPLGTRASVRDSAGVPILVLEITDSLWRAGKRSPLMPDHGKAAHLFVAGVDSLHGFAHLHPVAPENDVLASVLPPLPGGRYRLYADIVHESGMQRTLVDTFSYAPPSGGRPYPLLDPDDAWFDGTATSLGSATSASLGDGVSITWEGPRTPVVGRTGVLRFALAGRNGGPVIAEPYLGMRGHAVVMRHDGGVYVHLHPSGTSSMAPEVAFAARDRGDTTADGRLRLSMPHSMAHAAEPLREIAFPYAFPSAGTYRVWIQLRVGGSVRTAAFDVAVAAEPAPTS